MTDTTDDWTYVPRSKKSMPAKTIEPKQSRHIALEAVRTEWDAKSRVWSRSTCRQSIKRILERNAPEGGWSIENAICLGSGSVSRDNEDCRRRSQWQLVVFLDLCHVLDIAQIYAQEPAYDNTDKQWLEMQGIQVLPCLAAEKSSFGAASEFLTQATFLYEPFVEMTEEMLQRIQVDDISLYIGTSMRRSMEAQARSPKPAAVHAAKAFTEVRKMYKFPQLQEHPNVLEGLECFFKEDDEDAVE